MTTHLSLGLVAVWAMCLVSGGTASAQQADLETQVADLERRYEESVAAGDWQGVAALYAEDAIYAPLYGGLIEGRDGIASFYEQSGTTALDLRPSRTEMIGETGVLSLGTFTVTLPGEAGEMEVEGEYVTIGEVGENGLQLRSANIFPMRQMPGAPTQE